MLEIPPGISRTTLLKEAEFYGLQTIVAHIEAEKKKKPVVKGKGGKEGEEEREGEERGRRRGGGGEREEERGKRFLFSLLSPLHSFSRKS